MSPLITPEQALGIGFIFTRVIGIFLSFPLLNTSMIPLNVRVLFVVAFSFYVATIMDINVSVANISVLEIFLNILKELLIGFLLGVLVNIFIAAFSYAAELISYFMGLTIANMFDPTFGQISVLDRLFILIFYLLFFITGVYQIFLSGVIASFELFPVYQFHFNSCSYKQTYPTDNGIYRWFTSPDISRYFCTCYRFCISYLLCCFRLRRNG